MGEILNFPAELIQAIQGSIPADPLAAIGPVIVVCLIVGGILLAITD